MTNNKNHCTARHCKDHTDKYGTPSQAWSDSSLTAADRKALARDK